MDANAWLSSLVRLMLIPATAITGLMAVEVAGYTFDVDRPDSWADPRASHHDKHAISGAVLAPHAYLGLRSLGATAPAAKSGAIGITLFAAALYEIDNARRFGSWLDPVDVLWTVCGGLCAFGGIGTERWVVSPIFAPDQGGLAIGWRF